MPRTKGASGIVGWQRHMLMRDIAAGELNPDEIAERHGIPTQSVYDIRHRRKAELQVILDDWSNEFSDLWSVQKHDRVARLEYLADELQARLDELKADAEAATETMRKVHPEAAPVRVPMRDWRALTREQAKLLDQICREMGQDASTIDRIAGDASSQYKRQLLGLQPSVRVKDQKKYLTGVDQEAPPADLSGYRFEVDTEGRFRSLTAQERIDKIAAQQDMTVSEIKAQIEGEHRRHVDMNAERAFQQRYSELMELHGIVDDYMPATPAYVVDAVREAEEEFAKDYPNAVLVPEPVEEPVAEPAQAPEPAPVIAETMPSPTDRVKIP
jgi:primosomal protein N''